MVRAVGENSFQPKIGFKTRYGMATNPFHKGANADLLISVLVETKTSTTEEYKSTILCNNKKTKYLKLKGGF